MSEDAAEPAKDDLQAAITRYAVGGVRVARDHYKTDLDFSEESLQQVENILAKLYDSLPKGRLARWLKLGLSQKQLANAAAVFGAYVGEVIRRRWGGEWTLQSPFGDGTLTLNVCGGSIFPSAKVYKRLTEGPEDNVWLYYQVLRARFDKGS